MIDYYEELDLDSSQNLEELAAELSKRESVWKSRRTKAPDKAVKMLALIVDAREAFKTDAARAEYDRALAESKNAPAQPNTDAKREAEYRKWKRRAEEHYFDEQDDLALEAAKKALQLMNSENPDDSLYFLLSTLTYQAGDIQQAFAYINEAILLSPQSAYYYACKASILGDFFNAAIEHPNGLSTALDYLEQNRANHQKALELYKREGNIEGQIESLKLLAESYALIYNSDLERAESCVRQASALGDTSQELRDLMQQIQSGKTEYQPYQGSNHPSQQSGGGCYIATAVYGSYDCPEVWTLRRFRDYSLSRTKYGRAFIRCYYAVSPKLVELFGDQRWFNAFWKKRLDSMVNRLMEKGVSSEKYSD